MCASVQYSTGNFLTRSRQYLCKWFCTWCFHVNGGVDSYPVELYAQYMAIPKQYPTVQELHLDIFPCMEAAYYLWLAWNHLHHLTSPILEALFCLASMVGHPGDIPQNVPMENVVMSNLHAGGWGGLSRDMWVYKHAPNTPTACQSSPAHSPPRTDQCNFS